MESRGVRRKDARVELLRITGCFMVILIHIRMQPVVDGVILKTPVFIGAVITPAVGLFFLATGFFIYDGEKPFRKVGKQFLIKVFLPAIAVVFFSLLTEPWLVGEASFTDSVREADLPGILDRMKDGILNLSSDYWGPLSAHLWYVAEFAKIIFFYPAMVLIVRHAKPAVLKYMVGVNLLYCCLVDLYKGVGMFDFFILEPFLRTSQALVLAGCILYRAGGRMRRGKRKTVPALYLAAYAGMVVIIWIFQMKQFTLEGGGWGNAYYTTWVSGTGMLASIFLAGFLVTLPDDLKVLRRLEKPVLFLGDLSYPVYLIQFAVIAKMSAAGFDQPFKTLLPGSAGILFYYTAYGTAVFAVCILISLIFKTLLRCILTGSGKCFEKFSGSVWKKGN